MREAVERHYNCVHSRVNGRDQFSDLVIQFAVIETNELQRRQQILIKVLW